MFNRINTVVDLALEKIRLKTVKSNDRKINYNKTENRLDMDSQLSKEAYPVLIVESFESVGEHYRNDINAVWLRSKFFLMANLALIAYFYSTAFEKTFPSVFSISVTGLILSYVWMRIALVTVRWVNVWRNTLIDVEERMFNVGPYKRGENLKGNDFHEKFRPEEFSPVVASVFIFVWLIIFAMEILF